MSNSSITVLLLSVLSLSILHLFSFAPYGTFSHNMAIFSSSFVFISFYKALYLKKIEFLYLTPYLLMTWLYFQSPFLLEEKTYYFSRVIKDQYIDEIATYTSFSIVLIYLGYSLFLNKVPKPLISRDFKFSNHTLKQVCLFFIYLTIFYRVGKFVIPGVLNSLSSLIQILYFSPSIGLALYVLYLIRTKSKPNIQPFHLFILSVIFLEFLFRLSTTLMAQVGVLFIGMFIVYYKEKGKIPISLLLVILFIGVPLYQSRKFFRSETNKELAAEQSKLDFSLSIVDKVFFSEEEQKNDNYQEFLSKQEESEHNRFENLSFISHVVWQHKNGMKSFKYGETFYWLPLAPIPRIILPSKPQNLMGEVVSTNYGLRAKDSKASINFPMLVDAYINFNFQGMLFLAFCFGLAYKWIVMKFGAGIGDLNLIMIINVSKQFTHAEGNITLVFGAIIQVYVFWWVLVNIFHIERYLTSKTLEPGSKKISAKMLYK